METNATIIGFEEEKMNAVINVVRKLKNDQVAYIHGITGKVLKWFEMDIVCL